MITRLTNEQIKTQLVNEIEINQLLGFDSVSQALSALIRDEDFMDTWDISDQPKLIGLVMLAKKQVWPHMVKAGAK